MINKKSIFAGFGIIFLLLVIFYTGVFINAKNKPTSDPNSNQYITDLSSVSQNKVNAVTQNAAFFELDSNGNFNPKKSLTRVDAIIIIDKLAKQLIPSYNTTKPTVVPYFEDFKSSDANADAILRVVNLIDTKKDFYKHYNILGYQLKRQESITQREFLNLLGVFFPANKDLGEDYVIKNLMSYGFNPTGDLNGPITREDAAVYINLIVSNAK